MISGKEGIYMNCNCNRNRNCNCCGTWGRAQHIRVNQCASSCMNNGPFCYLNACCCRCRCCTREPERVTIDYACLRRAEREFERQVARCMGLCGFDEENAANFEGEENNPFAEAAQNYGENK